MSDAPDNPAAFIWEHPTAQSFPELHWHSDGCGMEPNYAGWTATPLYTAEAINRPTFAEDVKAMEAASKWISDVWPLLCPLKSEWQEAGFWSDYDEEVFNRRAEVNLQLLAALAARKAKT